MRSAHDGVHCPWVMALLLVLAVPVVMAQQTGAADAVRPATTVVIAQPVAINAPGPQQGAVEPADVKFIQPGMRAQPLGARGKMVIGIEDTYSPLNFGGMIAAAGFEQLTNGQPNYGTDRGAFGERLGAAAIRDTSQGVLTDGVFAVLLHEDPRYYVEGPRYSILHRALYAISRPLVTRKDNGRSTVNGALLLGYASASILNNAYYPSINRNVHDTIASFGGSVGGAALGFAIGEFTSGFWHRIHPFQRHP